MDKQEQKKILIDMMKSDEELGLYDDIEINRIELVCKDCSDSLEDCACIKSTIDFPKEEPNIISDWLEQNRNPEIDKQVEKELEYLSKQEIKLEDIFNDDKKENIKKFIDEINNPSEPNQALKDAAERYIAGDNYNRYYDDFPKQETLEEAAERIISDMGWIWENTESSARMVARHCAKWQQERSYSEEEVIAFGEFIFKHSLLTHAKGVKNLFEQFKKK
jgi:adenylate kinase family enzyme